MERAPWADEEGQRGRTTLTPRGSRTSPPAALATCAACAVPVTSLVTWIRIDFRIPAADRRLKSNRRPGATEEVLVIRRRRSCTTRKCHRSQERYGTAAWVPVVWLTWWARPSRTRPRPAYEGGSVRTISLDRPNSPIYPGVEGQKTRRNPDILSRRLPIDRASGPRAASPPQRKGHYGAGDVRLTPPSPGRQLIGVVAPPGSRPAPRAVHAPRGAAA